MKIPYFLRFKFGWTSVVLSVRLGQGIHVQHIPWCNRDRLAGWSLVLGWGPWEPKWFGFARIPAMSAREVWAAAQDFWSQPMKYE